MIRIVEESFRRDHQVSATARRHEISRSLLGRWRRAFREGRLLAQRKRHHRHQEFLSFLNHIDANVPADLDVYLVIDNYATHKHLKTWAWLTKRPRFHVHFTPTYASWLNQVERWFALITERQIRRGSFISAKELVAKIDAFVQAYNAKASPFVWTANAEAILDKVARLCKAINGTTLANSGYRLVGFMRCSPCGALQSLRRLKFGGA